MPFSLLSQRIHVNKLHVNITVTAFSCGDQRPTAANAKERATSDLAVMKVSTDNVIITCDSKPGKLIGLCNKVAHVITTNTFFPVHRVPKESREGDVQASRE